ncbi:hypothetical protein [Janthinobacterium sp. RB2R34]|uniref:hypothetical protein n=1 Tax=Janthinobacterium sp. RB2R34 TaxID=3424193 RepID=UPI003F25352A
MTHTHTIELQGSIEQMRTRIAIEQGAMHQVQLSVARWRGGVACTHGCRPGPAMAASQVRWHAAAQDHFLCWLAGGGFARAIEDEVLNHDPVASAQGATHETAIDPAPVPARPAPCPDCTA